jgi:meso-butanediol dehydrogenase/(S,S)-butanediol dehydrogenase/diacetyl reductase
MQRFDGRTAIVTGAASGIGRATALRFAEEGATVIACDANTDGLDETIATARKATDVPMLPCPGDVSDPALGRALVALALEATGQVDVVANVAGILRTGHTHEHDLATWNQVLAVNLTGTFLCCQAAIPALLESGGNIVNVSSTSALAGQPWSAAYSASKAGVLALTRTIAVEYGRQGLRANAVCPGSIETPITEQFVFPEGADVSLVKRIMPLDRSRGPETVAAAIAFLASDDAAHINGEHVRVDGATLS